jgi:hypothetical protein
VVVAPAALAERPRRLVHFGWQVDDAPQQRGRRILHLELGQAHHREHRCASAAVRAGDAGTQQDQVLAQHRGTAGAAAFGRLHVVEQGIGVDGDRIVFEIAGPARPAGIAAGGAV